jgi:streptomycin 6-kinase
VFPLSYSYVEPVRRASGEAAVLKLRPPGDAELRAETAALRAYAGEGAARLLEDDPGRGAMLLERLDPGTALVALAERDDDAATLAAAGVMRRLSRPAPAGHPFPDVLRWGAALAHVNVPLPRTLVERARDEYADLCASSAPPVLLHGDLHHLNLLSTGSGWAAIDPKGLVGEPAYETAALLRNPLGLLDAARPGRMLARRIAVLAEALGFDRERIGGWARTQAVLAAQWSLEMGDPPGARRFRRIAELHSA